MKSLSLASVHFIMHARSLQEIKLAPEPTAGPASVHLCVCVCVGTGDCTAGGRMDATAFLAWHRIGAQWVFPWPSGGQKRCVGTVGAGMD